MSGKLRMGDRILAVNGKDVTRVTHEEAVLALLESCQEIALKIQHDPHPEGFQVRMKTKRFRKNSYRTLHMNHI